MSLSVQAYELFSQAKTPVEVAIELDIRESQVTKYYREYWKLKGLYKLNLVYEEIKADIAYFVKLHRLSKAAGMSTEHVVNLLEIANNDLQSVERRYQKLQRNVNYLESKALDAGITLEDLKSQIQNANQMLDSYHLSCEETNEAPNKCWSYFIIIAIVIFYRYSLVVECSKKRELIYM